MNAKKEQQDKDERILVKALLVHLNLEFTDVNHLYEMIYNTGVFQSDQDIQDFLLSLGK